MSSPLFRLAGRVLGVLALIVWTLLVAEAFIRLVAPQALMPRYVTGTPWGIRGNIPGATYSHVTPEVDVTYHINAQGMRDDQTYALDAPTGTCRIALFGDSYTIGYELALKDTYAKRLEALLSQDGYRVQVLNFGVSGFGTAENLRSYEAFGRRFHPDLVLMQWQVTDYDDNSRSGLYRLDGDRLVSGKASYLPGIAIQDRLMRWQLYRLLADHSHAYNFAREQIGWRGKQLLALWSKKQAAPDEGGEVENGDYAISPSQSRLSGALLLHARNVVEGDGARFATFDIPNRSPVPQFSSSYVLLPAAVQQQLPPISPLPAFRNAAAQGQRLFYSTGARHLTPLGADLMARAMVARIAQDHLLDHCHAASS